MTTETPVETVATEETPEAIRAATLAGFNSVMTGEPPVIEAPEEPAAEVTEEPAAEEVKTEPEPETIVLTKAQWEDAQAKLARIDEFDKKLTDSYSRTNGQLGEFNKALRDLKASQGGKKVNIEQFKELAADYPDIVKGVVEGLNAGIPEPEPVAAPEPVKDSTADEVKALKETTQVLAIKLALTAVDPAWEELTSTAEFAKWRDSHPADVAKEIQFGRDPKYLADALKGYKGHQKAEADKAAAAKAAEEAAKPKPKQTNTRLAAAITPTGAPPAGRKPTDDRAEMLKGFQSVMSK